MYSVKSVVSDYGIYEEKRGSLICIMNSNYNANLVCAILNYDEKHDGQRLTSQPIPKEILEDIRCTLEQHKDIDINYVIASEFMAKPET